MTIADDELAEKLKQEIKAVGVRSWARTHGFKATYVSYLGRGERPITEEVAASMGYKPAGRRWITIARPHAWHTWSGGFPLTCLHCKVEATSATDRDRLDHGAPCVDPPSLLRVVDTRQFRLF